MIYNNIKSTTNDEVLDMSKYVLFQIQFIICEYLIYLSSPFLTPSQWNDVIIIYI